MAQSPLTLFLTETQAQTLKSLLDQKNYIPANIPYTRYAYKGDGLTIALYIKKNKLLVQGKNTNEFIEFLLEPYVTGVLNLLPATAEVHLPSNSLTSPHTKKASSPHSINNNLPIELDSSPHFGIDESGKGDYLGPLVIAGVYTDATTTAILAQAGVCDSKAIGSPTRIRQLAQIIKNTPNIEYQIVCIGPERYNELYNKLNNLNTLLAWGHITVIQGLLEKRPDCPRALSDQFAKSYVLQRELNKRNLSIILDQRTKAESDIAVAAASILARERFINWMDKAAEAANINLPLGANGHVIAAARSIVSKYGKEFLPKIAKMHFKSTLKVLNKP